HGCVFLIPFSGRPETSAGCEPFAPEAGALPSFRADAINRRTRAALAASGRFNAQLFRHFAGARPASLGASIGPRSDQFRRRNMPLLTNEKTPLHSLWGALVPTLGALLLFSLFGMQALAQEPLTQSAQSEIPLADLLQEAEKNNPQIEAARQGWQ